MHSYTVVNESDQTETLLSQVQMAWQNKQALAVQGNGSKSFLIHELSGECLSTASHRGIINYFPSELTVTVRSGTLLCELKEVLAKEGQMLPFEPPAFSKNATIGGTIASGLSGPARPFVGSARDFVLGCKVINGKGELLQFGGEVMKNVAGYDLSRLITGSYGSLGVILEVSLKLLPIVAKEQTLKFSLEADQFTQYIQRLLLSGHAVSAACYLDGQAYIRLSGSEKGVTYSQNEIRQSHAELQEIDRLFWSELNEQTLPFFNNEQPLWRLSLPKAINKEINGSIEQFMTVTDKQLIDWGGSLRWLYSNQSAEAIRHIAQSLGGHAQLFRANTMDSGNDISKQQPLMPAMLKLHQQIKRSIDPHLLFNKGCIYPEL